MHNFLNQIESIKKKKIAMSAHFFTLQCTETPEQVASECPTRNSPRIAAFVGEEAKQYFVIVEQKVLCQVPSFQCFSNSVS